MRDIRPSVNAADLADIDEFTNRFGTRTVAGRAVGAGVTSDEAAAVADIADGTDEVRVHTWLVVPGLVVAWCRDLIAQKEGSAQLGKKGRDGNTDFAEYASHP